MSQKIKKQTPTHIVIVHWVSDTLTVLAQEAPVPHADRTERRVLFVDHQPGRDPLLEAIGIARSIARKNKRPDIVLT